MRLSLVNNASVGAVGTVADNTDAQWHQVFDVNVVGIVRATRAALPWLRAFRHAAIVNTCSIAATAALPQRAPYSGTKGAAGTAYPASPLACSVTGTARAIDSGMAGLRTRPRS